MKSFYDNIYSSRIFELRHPGDTLKDEIIFDEILKVNNKSDAKILDIGCGMGHTSILLSRISHRLIGIDVSFEGVRVAKEKVKCDFMVSDSTRLPFKNEYFDIIVMKDILEHVENDSQAIKEVYRVLKMDGLLILYVPYSLDDAITFESIVKKISGYSIDDNIGHLRRYDIIILKDLLNNFEIIKSFYFAHLLFGIMSVFGTLYSKKKPEMKKDNKSKNRLLFISLMFIKLLGKAEFIILQRFKGAGIFIIAQKDR